MLGLDGGEVKGEEGGVREAGLGVEGLCGGYGAGDGVEDGVGVAGLAGECDGMREQVGAEVLSAGGWGDPEAAKLCRGGWVEAAGDGEGGRRRPAQPRATPLREASRRAPDGGRKLAGGVASSSSRWRRSVGSMVVVRCAW